MVATTPMIPGRAEVPLVRKLLGDESIASIGLTKPTPQLLARVKAVFPEARCYVLERIFTLQIAGNASQLVLSRWPPHRRNFRHNLSHVREYHTP